MSESFIGILSERPVREARLIQQAACISAIGKRVTSSSACFYLPAAGNRNNNNGSLNNVGNNGNYWSSTRNSSNSNNSYNLNFNSSNVNPGNNNNRANGFSVRCISELNINLILWGIGLPRRNTKDVQDEG
ncbi:hypothetical protein D0T84_00515 [Dysgonomonas sp. 521]|uniref:FISUMP domain-containing protein n=1 Tax=Dysgonomonas sp. 521 TaxID=2302932 RepID=UPI0013D32E72|nr:FISUMP domain-containing protein [Dysgonomonas sp. 521]NDV93401.1 hypothetical protein [Dysgonomonas sp. 521]